MVNVDSKAGNYVGLLAAALYIIAAFVMVIVKDSSLADGQLTNSTQYVLIVAGLLAIVAGIMLTVSGEKGIEKISAIILAVLGVITLLTYVFIHNFSMDDILVQEIIAVIAIIAMLASIGCDYTKGLKGMVYIDILFLLLEVVFLVLILIDNNVKVATAASILVIGFWLAASTGLGMSAVSAPAKSEIDPERKSAKRAQKEKEKQEEEAKKEQQRQDKLEAHRKEQAKKEAKAEKEEKKAEKKQEVEEKKTERKQEVEEKKAERQEAREAKAEAKAEEKAAEAQPEKANNDFMSKLVSSKDANKAATATAEGAVAAEAVAAETVAEEPQAEEPAAEEPAAEEPVEEEVVVEETVVEETIVEEPQAEEPVVAKVAVEAAVAAAVIEAVDDDEESEEDEDEILEDIYTDYSPEALVRRAAWNKGLRCRRDYGDYHIPVAFVKGKVAVYVVDPAEADTSNDAKLEAEGWVVLRYDLNKVTDGQEEATEIANAVKANVRAMKAKKKKKPAKK